MAAVEDDPRPLADHLQPSRPPRRGKSFAKGGVLAYVEQVCRRDRQGGVPRLVVADQRQAQVAMLEPRSPHAEHVSIPSHGCRLELHLDSQAQEPAEERRHPVLDDGQRLALASRQRDIALFDDRHLLARDLGDGVAEVLLVVEVDVRDDRDSEVERVGRVEPAAETDLAHQDVGPRGEIRDRHRGQHLELRRRTLLGGDRVEGRHQLLERPREVALADGAPIDFDALGVGDEVRLGHEPDVVARGTEDRAQACPRRSFSIRAGDQCSAHGPVGCANAVEDGSGAFRAELHRKAALPRDEVEGLPVGQALRASTA